MDVHYSMSVGSIKIQKKGSIQLSEISDRGNSDSNEILTKKIKEHEKFIIELKSLLKDTIHEL